MANNNKKTVLQRLTDVVIGGGTNYYTPRTTSVTYNLPSKLNNNDALYTFSSKDERDSKLLQLKQQKLLSFQWKKSGYDTSMEQLAGATQTKIMYRDADLMDQWPEITKALDIKSEEATCLKNGKMLNVYSKSERIKAVLEDLFDNRLSLKVILPEIAREMCKYGNDFRLLNIDVNEGILGWRQLPVQEMRRIENGLNGLYGNGTITANLYNLKPDETKFIWEGHNEQMPFKNWQVAHFRLIRNATFLPYGVSDLNSARRYWRMLSMMEDAMMIYRLERSIERRIFKVNVGAIDDVDVPAFLQEFANTFKRAPIVDPLTGQVDLRKNFLDASHDYFIPVRSGQDPTSIDTLQSAQNATSMDDIQYMENKLLTCLGVPKAFLNFQEAQGKAQNLSLMDIRFCRSINYIQQVLLMELTKIAIIHLYLLGFEDELTNFTLSLNNPSNQIELMELDNITKRIAAATSALAEQGCGIPLMSWHGVQKEIMGKTDAEIATMLNEIRLESAISTELQLTNQIIKKTGLFDKVDRIYGEPGAKYDFSQLEGGEGPGGGGLGGGAAMGGDFGGDDFGSDFGGGFDEPGGDLEGDVSGETGGADLDSPDMSNLNEVRNIIDASNQRKKQAIDEYINEVLTGEKDGFGGYRKQISDTLFINEELDTCIKGMELIEEQINKDNELTLID